jgi:hypothetical protein
MGLILPAGNVAAEGSVHSNESLVIRRWFSPHVYIYIHALEASDHLRMA